MVVVILEAVGAYRGVQAPSVLIKKAAPEVRMAMAYGRLSDPEDLLIGFCDWANLVDYAYDRKTIRLYELSFEPSWRAQLLKRIAAAPTSATVYVTQNVCEPSYMDAVEQWQRTGEANGMRREEVVPLIEAGGELQRSTTFPAGPIWELRRAKPGAKGH
jgi:hypothetical protein